MKKLFALLGLLTLTACVEPEPLNLLTEEEEREVVYPTELESLCWRKFWESKRAGQTPWTMTDKSLCDRGML
jgi:hypothetical protein